MYNNIKDQRNNTKSKFKAGKLVKTTIPRKNFEEGDITNSIYDFYTIKKMERIQNQVTIDIFLLKDLINIY